MYDDILLIFRYVNKPYVITLVGPPNCGKSTFISYFKSVCIRKRLDSFKVISRDDILLEVSDTDDYNKAWNSVDHNLVNSKLNDRFDELSNSSENVIIDMTSMTSKGRKLNNNKFKNHYKIAVVIKYDKEELIKRNEERKIKENKFIPIDVINSMIDSYVSPSLEEGFDLIIRL